MSTARLDSLRELAAEHDGELSAWLEAGIERWREGESLDRALGVCGTDAVRERDLAIRRAAAIANPDGLRKPHTLAGDLEMEIRRFEGVKWKRCRHMRDPNLSPFDRALFDALRACDQSGISMLRSQRRLYDLIR